jgi:hypothetical protein
MCAKKENNLSRKFDKKGRNKSMIIETMRIMVIDKRSGLFFRYRAKTRVNNPTTIVRRKVLDPVVVPNNAKMMVGTRKSILSFFLEKSKK